MCFVARALFGWKALIQYVSLLVPIHQEWEIRWFKHCRANHGTRPPRWSHCENALLQRKVEGSTRKATSPSFRHIWLSRYNTHLSMRHLLHELQWKNKEPYSSSSPPWSHVGRKPSLPFPSSAARWQAVHFASLKPYVPRGLPVIPFLMGTWTGSSPSVPFESSGCSWRARSILCYASNWAFNDIITSRY